MAEIRTTQVDLKPNYIDLGIGQPDFALLPVDIMERAAAHRLALHETYLLNYGYEQGEGYCRLALAAFLSREYGQPVDASRLFLTAGASQGLDLLCTLFSQPGDVIFVEEPSYFIALRIFADHGLTPISLPTDDHGLDVDALEEALTRHRPAFLYTIPTFQNPTGTTLSQSRRERLAAISQYHDLLVIADEVYHLLAYTDRPPPPLATYVDEAPILSVGSFSKILAPGLRLGWIQASPAVIDKLTDAGVVFSGGSLNHFTSAIVRSVLELDMLGPYIAGLRTVYHERAQALASALVREIPDGAFRPVEGGFFIWLQLPEAVDSRRLLAHAERYAVGFQPGVNFSSRQALHNSLRLSFAFYDIPALQTGVARLRRALDATLSP